jgi:translation initiation factor 2 beta subunit (eIF-2beta)/eIF-5
MHDSGAAVAEPDDAPLSLIGLGGNSSTRSSLPLPVLLDTRLVRAELSRLRIPRQGNRTVGPARARIARSHGRSDGGRLR